MTGDTNKFNAIKYKDRGTVLSENSSELKVIGICDIELNLNFIIWKALLIKNMRFNLLTINQLCDFITLIGRRINLLWITNIFLKYFS